VFLEVKTENEITSGEDREDNQSEEPVRKNEDYWILLGVT
jgi:hypothetical protein